MTGHAPGGRRGRLLGAAVVVCGVVFFLRTPLAVRLDARRLASSDPLVRSCARQRLLAVGRPTIDAIYPELIAGEVLDETTNVIAAVVVSGGVVLARHPDFPAAVLDVAPIASPTCPTALLLARDRAPRELRVLAVRAKTDRAPELRLAVALDADADRVLAAVKAKLGP